MTEKITPRLKTKYAEEVRPALLAEFKHANVMEVGGITKVVVNMGVGEAAHDSKQIEGAARDLAAITGQKAQITKARKSIAQFKLREAAHRCLRHPAWRPHVGVPGPPDFHLAAPVSATSVG